MTDGGKVNIVKTDSKPAAGQGVVVLGKDDGPKKVSVDRAGRRDGTTKDMTAGRPGRTDGFSGNDVAGQAEQREDGPKNVTAGRSGQRENGPGNAENTHPDVGPGMEINSRTGGNVDRKAGISRETPKKPSDGKNVKNRNAGTDEPTYGNGIKKDITSGNSGNIQKSNIPQYSKEKNTNNIAGGHRREKAAGPGGVRKGPAAAGNSVDIKAETIKENRKVRTDAGTSEKVRVDRTSASKKASTSAGRSGKVTAGREAAAEEGKKTRLDILRSNDGRKKLERIRLSKGDGTPPVKGTAPSILTTPKETPGNGSGSFLKIAAAIAAFILFLVIMAAVAYINELLETWDLGYDRMTYLATKYTVADKLDDQATLGDDWIGPYKISFDDDLQDYLDFCYRYKNGENLYDDFEWALPENISRDSLSGNLLLKAALILSWKKLAVRPLQGIDLAVDQQIYIIKKYYDPEEEYIERTFGLDMTGGSYAVKGAVLSIALSFHRYHFGSDEASVETDRQALYDGIDWTGGEDGILRTLYANAKELGLGYGDARWEAELEDALALLDGSLDMYGIDVRPGVCSIYWLNHVQFREFLGKEPVDGLMYASDPPTGIVSLAALDDECERVAEDYVPSHDETGGALVYEYIDFAKNYIGVTPYISGGGSLTSGADCSGFISAVLNRFGLNNGVRSYTWSGDWSGWTVSMSDLREGDIIFSGPVSTGHQKHVVMYIGNGLVIHNSSPGTFVHISPLSGQSGIVNGEQWKIYEVRRFVATPNG